MQIEKLTIVGVGLIGGSIGLAARRRGIAQHVHGIGRNRQSLDRAVLRGAIDQGSTFDDTMSNRHDLVVVCTPVDQIVRHVRSMAMSLRTGNVITDAGSTKAQIVRELQGLPRGHFVGSHPLAGSELKGVENARDDLFEGRVTVVTPTQSSDPAAVQKIVGFWKALGSEVRILDPETHDRALAATSHLPHLVAAALAGVLPAEFRPFTASGFRDTTRIAASDPALWVAIFRQNRAALAGALRPFSERLAALLEAIDRDDADRLSALLTEAKQVRDALGS